MDSPGTGSEGVVSQYANRNNTVLQAYPRQIENKGRKRVSSCTIISD